MGPEYSGKRIHSDLFLSALLILGSMLFIDDILYAFGGSAQTIPYAKSYLMIVIPGSVFVNLSYSFSGVMRAAGYPQNRCTPS